MAKFLGEALFVSVDTGDGNGKVICTFSQTCKLTMDATMANATTKDSAGWEEVLPSTKKWSIECDGLVDYHPSSTVHNIGNLFDQFTNGASVTVQFALANGVTGDLIWTGTAYISKLDENAKLKDIVSYTATFTGTSVLTKTVHA